MDKRERGIESLMGQIKGWKPDPVCLKKAVLGHP